ncbi:MAG: hypothetical protein OEY29_09935 [Gammaproteobacteria bacterium]|nr:hypothetical protein [Gammaproteobacteria bacterium]
MLMRLKIKYILLIFAVFLQAGICLASEKEQRAITDQKIKLNTLMVVKDAVQLVEDIAYPEQNRFKLYLTHSSGKYFTIEKLTVIVDGIDKVTHRYDELKQNALLRGGSSRIYRTSVSEGVHELVVVFDGTDRDKNIIKNARTFLLDKKAGEMIVVVSVKDNDQTLRPDFEFSVIKGQ